MRGRRQDTLRRVNRLLLAAQQEKQVRVRDGDAASDRTVYPSGTMMYCPHRPSVQQQKFLDCQAREVLYGGACAGGKTDALLMDALDGVMHPKYSALILRRSFQRLSKPGSIMNRLAEWLSKYPEVLFNRTDHTFTFPSGAVITFGYLDSLDDRLQYQSAEYQFIGFDELTEFNLPSSEYNPYLFMLSRLRKTDDITIRLKMRSATNPGGPGHTWVKNRFITPACEDALESGLHDTIYVGSNDEEVKDEIRAFIPAKLEDNVALEAEEYKRNLEELPPIVRARLLHGDWTVQEDSLFDPKDFRYYTTRGNDYLTLNMKHPYRTAIDGCRRFGVLDTAGTTPSEIKRGTDNSCWSALGIFDYDATENLLYLVHVWRNRERFNELCSSITRKSQAFGCSCVYIEKAHFGDAVHDVMQRDGSVRTELLSRMKMPKGFQETDPAKVKRATAAFKRLDKGLLFFPESASWLHDYTSELMSWTGDPNEEADQIDITSYACMLVEKAIPVTMSLGAASGQGMFDDLVPQFLDQPIMETGPQVFDTVFGGDHNIGFN